MLHDNVIFKDQEISDGNSGLWFDNFLENEGQTIPKANFMSSIFPKNEQKNHYLSIS